MTATRLWTAHQVRARTAATASWRPANRSRRGSRASRARSVAQPNSDPTTAATSTPNISPPGTPQAAQDQVVAGLGQPVAGDRGQQLGAATAAAWSKNAASTTGRPASSWPAARPLRRTGTGAARPGAADSPTATAPATRCRLIGRAVPAGAAGRGPGRWSLGVGQLQGGERRRSEG